MNFDWKKWIVILCLAVAVGLLISSCRTARDNKALTRVEANNNLLDKAGRVWEKSHPCVIDTVVQFKNGVEVVRYDTLYNDIVSTVYDTATKTEVQTKYKTIIKYVTKTDTIKIQETDLRRLNLALADNTKKQAENDQLKAELKASQQRSAKKTWIIVILGSFILLLGILKFYLK